MSTDEHYFIEQTEDARFAVRAKGSARASAIPLNPVNSSQLSETIVSVPISELRSRDYLIAIQNATAREQAVEACARLNH